MSFAWLERPRDVQPYIGGWRYGQLAPCPMPPVHRRGRAGTFLRRLGVFLGVWSPPAGGRHRAAID